MGCLAFTWAFRKLPEGADWLYPLNPLQRNIKQKCDTCLGFSALSFQFATNLCSEIQDVCFLQEANVLQEALLKPTHTKYVSISN
jgi:hypothetical protein